MHSIVEETTRLPPLPQELRRTPIGGSENGCQQRHNNELIDALQFCYNYVTPRTLGWGSAVRGVHSIGTRGKVLAATCTEMDDPFHLLKSPLVPDS